MSIPISQFIPPLRGIHTFILYVCVSISAMQIRSSLPFFYILHIYDICFYNNFFFKKKAHVTEIKKAASRTHFAQAHSENHGHKGEVSFATPIAQFRQLDPNHNCRGLYQSPDGRFKEMNNNIIIYPVPALGQIFCQVPYVHYR